MALLFSLFVALAHAASFPTTTTLKTESGPAVAAWYGVPSRAQHGVVLIHGDGRTKDDWLTLADKLYKSGNAVIAVDLRKASATGGALTPEDYRHMVEEVRAAAAFLHTKGVAHLALVGADLGANLCINEAADDPTVVSVVMLSPGMDLRGIIANDAVARYGARPLLLVASADDSYGSRTVRTLDALAKGEHQVETYEHAGKGTQMFNQEPGLSAVVTGFLTRSWTAATSTAPTSAPSTTLSTDLSSAPIVTTAPPEP
jgi:alpha-beta hydrolase superfamily lysophospholipase